MSIETAQNQNQILQSNPDEDFDAFFDRLTSEAPSAVNEKDVVKNAQPGFGDYLVDAGKGLVSGPFKFVENTTEGIAALGDAIVDRPLNYMFGEGSVDLFADNADFDFVPDWLKPQTGVGNTAQAIASFVSGYITVGAAMKGAQAGAKMVGGGLEVADKILGTDLATLFNSSEKAKAFAEVAAAGGAIDFFVDGNKGERLSNVLVDNDILRNGLTEALMSKDDDTVFEARVKNMVEGFVMSGVAEMFARTWKWVRKSSHAATTAEKAAIRAEAADDLQKLAKSIDESAFVPKAGAYPSDGTFAKEILGEQNADKILKQAQGLKLTKSTAINPRTLNSVSGKLAVDLDEDIVVHASKYKYPTKELRENAMNTAMEILNSADEDGYGTLAKEAAAAGKRLTDNMVAMCAVVQQDYTPKTLLSLEIWKDDIGNVAKKEQYVNQLARLVDSFAKLHDVKYWTGYSLQANKRGIFEAKSVTNVGKTFGMKEIKDALLEKVDDKSLMELGNCLNGCRDVGLSDAKTSTFIIQQAKRALGDKEPLTPLKILNSWVKFYFYNSVLSGPSTLTANVVGNAINVGLIDGSDIFWSGLYGKKGAFGRTAAYYKGLGEAWEQASKCFWATLKTGNPILDGATRIDGAGKNLFKANADNIALKVLDSPTRALAALDEITKQLSYRGHLSVQFYDAVRGDPIRRQWLKNGNRKALGAFKEKFFKEAYKDSLYSTTGIMRGGEASLANIAEIGLNSSKALEAARRTSFQAPLKGWMAPIAQGLNACPFGYLIAPFIKTPVNIFKDAMIEHNPITLLFKLSRAETPEMAQKYFGQFMTGLMVWGTAGTLVANGALTGSGPSNPAARKLWLESGMQPYSIKIGDIYVSYNQFEPLATPFALIADMHDKLKECDPKNPAEQANLVAAAFNTLTRSTMDKTFMKGIANFVSMLDNARGGGADAHAKAYANQLMSSFVPSLANTAARLIDNTRKEQKDWFAPALARIPGVSKTVSTQFSWLTGLPVEYSTNGGLGPMLNTFLRTSVKKDNDVVFATLTQTTRNRTPSHAVVGVTMNDAMYSEFCETMGNTRINGKNLYQALDALIRSSTWARAVPNPSEGTLSEQKEQLIDTVVNRYKTRAVKEYIKRYPDIAEHQAALYRFDRDVARGKEVGTRPVYEGLASVGRR